MTMETKIIKILEEEIRALELKSYLIAQVLPEPEKFNRADKVIFVLQEAVLKLINLDNEADGL